MLSLLYRPHGNLLRRNRMALCVKLQSVTNLQSNFMVTPCINNAEPFYYQLMHIMLKNTELLKHSKINKNAPTCFGLHRNHLQGSKVSAWLKITHLVNSICVKDVQGVVSAMAA